MSYETEQIQYAKELKDVERDFDILDKFLKEHPELKVKQRYGFDIHFDAEEYKYKKILENKYHVFDTYNDSKYMLQYRILKHRKDELEYNLQRSKTSRNIDKAVNYIGSITPQHVSGRMYKVENGAGCGTFCMWFMIIDALIIFICYIISHA